MPQTEKSKKKTINKKKPPTQNLVQEKTAEFKISTPQMNVSPNNVEFSKNKLILGKDTSVSKLEESGELQVVEDPISQPNTSLTPMQMVAVAVQQNAPIEKIEKLMELQERWEKREAEKAFVSAMSAFKAEHLTIMKGKHVKYQNNDGSWTEYDHATLDNICEIVAPVLSKHGLSHRWTTEQASKDEIKVTCYLTHKLGHSEMVSLIAAPDKSGGKNAIQAVGSTSTYLERYTFLAICGIAVKDMDDDGRSVTQGNDSAMPKEEIKKHTDNMKKAKTIDALQNIQKRATAAANKYKDESAYEEMKAVYVECKKKLDVKNG